MSRGINSAPPPLVIPASDGPAEVVDNGPSPATAPAFSALASSNPPSLGEQSAPIIGVPLPASVPETFEDCFYLPDEARDSWAMWVYVIFVLGFGILSIYAITGWLETLEFQGRGIYDSRNDYGPTTSTMILFAFVLTCGTIFSVVYFIALRAFTKQTVWFTSAANIGVGLGSAIYYFSAGETLAGAAHLLFGVFYMYCFWDWKDRLRFAITMIEQTMDIANRFGHIFRVSAIGGAMAVGFAVWFAITFVAVYIRYTPDPNNPACEGLPGGPCSRARLIGLLAYVMFGGYWISEVIKNIIHVSVSGVFGSWYFLSHDLERIPKKTTLLAIKRALWYSFGSIAYGSLASSIVQFLHQASSINRESDCHKGFPHVIYAIEWPGNWLLKFFNHYAYSRMAFDSLGYTTSVKKILRLLAERDIDVLVNNNLVDPVLTAGAAFTGYLCASFSYLYLISTDPPYNNDGRFTFIVMGVSFLMGLQIFNISLVSIKSGVTTICTSIAVNPIILRRDHQHFYSSMVGAYHKVSEVSSLQVPNIL